jgi:hypothetical protein
MEHIDEAGVTIDLDNTYLNHYRKYEFYFFRESSKIFKSFDYLFKLTMIITKKKALEKCHHQKTH